MTNADEGWTVDFTEKQSANEKGIDEERTQYSKNCGIYGIRYSNTINIYTKQYYIKTYIKQNNKLSLKSHSIL